MNMKNNIVLIVLLTVLVSSCRKDEGFDGPSVSEIYSDFTFTENFKANVDSVDFAAGQQAVFTAKFNKIVKWEISITGINSKAKKVISGESRSINATWNGSTTLYPMFGKEKCNVALSLKDISDTVRTTIVVKQAKTVTGFIIADFETGLNPLWTKFIQTGANMDFKVKTDALAPQGKNYLNMAGTVNWDYLIGLIDFNAKAYNNAVVLPLNANPDAVYFNCLIYGVPNTNSTIVLFQFKEDENADGTFNANNEDEYDLEVNVDWEGWKLVSYKYSDITTLVNGAPAAAKGNKLHNADKIGKISMLHLANPNNGFASTKIDMIIFTENKAIEL